MMIKPETEYRMSDGLTPEQEETWKSLQESPYGYLLHFWDGLDKAQRSNLLDQIATLNFERIARLHSAHETADTGRNVAKKASAPTTLIPADFRESDPQRFQQAEAIGCQALQQGKVGVMLVAGGEGTRLGFPHPKGKFPIGPVSNKSLYQLLAEQVVALQLRSQAIIPYYVMTSHATHDETALFFEEHKWFGLNQRDVYFFRQGQMPAVDKRTGRVLLAARDSVVFSPDGHGGLLEAMQNAKLFDDLRQRKIELLFYHQVDNPLVRVCDPAFIGFHLLNKAEVSTKVVVKENPAEKVGLLVEVDARHHMIEYVDLPEELAAQRDSAGKLRLRCGNIAVHLFGTEFLERITKENDGLPFHRSSKSVPHVNESGEAVHPKETNAYKFERFIFDILPFAKNPVAMEVIREHEFVPLKNRDGEFSPDHVRSAMRRLHTGWLKQAGMTNEDELPVEIAASIALDQAEFQARFQQS